MWMCGKGKVCEIWAGLAETWAALLCGDKVLIVHSNVGSVAHIPLWSLWSFYSLNADSRPSERSDSISLKCRLWSLLWLSEMSPAFPTGVLAPFHPSQFCVIIIHPESQFFGFFLCGGGGCLYSSALISSPPLCLGPSPPFVLGFLRKSQGGVVRW